MDELKDEIEGMQKSADTYSDAVKTQVKLSKEEMKMRKRIYAQTEKNTRLYQEHLKRQTIASEKQAIMLERIAKILEKRMK